MAWRGRLCGGEGRIKDQGFSLQSNERKLMRFTNSIMHYLMPPIAIAFDLHLIYFQLLLILYAKILQ